MFRVGELAAVGHRATWIDWWVVTGPLIDSLVSAPLTDGVELIESQSQRIDISMASRAGVYYTPANGGKIMNLGEQHVPVLLANGTRSILTFQVAEVSRPLMSIVRLCEMGNRVLFGANGGVILNIQTGEVTLFHKEEKVYTFELWIPPVSEAPFGRPQ